MTGPDRLPSSVLGLHAGAGAVTAVAVGPDGGTAAVAGRDWDGATPERLWAAALAVTREVTGGSGGNAPAAVGLCGDHDVLLVWDEETLGAARPVDTGTGSLGALLARLASEEPHTWAHLVEGRYAVGPAVTYLLARMTRGTWHATDVASASRSGLWDLAAGRWSARPTAGPAVPATAQPPPGLPEVLPTWGGPPTTDGRSFGGLEVPVRALADALPATLVARGLVHPGDEATLPGPTLATVTGPAADADPVRTALALWRAPGGDTTHGTLRPAPGRSVRPATGPEPALGAAYLAGLGAGLWPDLDATAEVAARVAGAR